jgi:choline dehydrogenase-like flavoprotein
MKLRIENSGDRADAVVFQESCGNRRSILRAETIILATGAIENARLLLATGGPCNRSGWVGRNFMEHPRDYTMRWTPTDPAIYRDLHFYDQHEADGGVTIMGRLGVDEAALRHHGLTQGSLTLLPRAPVGLLRRMASRLGFADAARYPEGGAGWSERDPTGENLDYIQLLLNLEQAPHRDNTVSLQRPGTEARDGPVSLDWRWRPEDQRRLEGLRRIIADAFEGSGYGPVEMDATASPDPNAHHHAGTTRMSDDPALGVVDRDGRIHGLGNVYCAGASVFPSAGFANPTLTIVALALRLAAHLASVAGD